MAREYFDMFVVGEAATRCSVVGMPEYSSDSKEDARVAAKLEERLLLKTIEATKSLGCKAESDRLVIEKMQDERTDEAIARVLNSVKRSDVNHNQRSKASSKGRSWPRQKPCRRRHRVSPDSD
jgi:hypothetical protein